MPDCNFRESLAKLEKSKLLIICLKFTFGELSSKILFECSGNFLVFENFGENEITGFASLIMQKSHSKLAKFNTLVLKQYATLESEVDFE